MYVYIYLYVCVCVNIYLCIYVCIYDYMYVIYGVRSQQAQGGVNAGPKAIDENQASLHPQPQTLNPKP